MTDADYFTYQFYTWEYRGRGMHVCEEPIHLEAPFIPFFRHRAHPAYIDDGKRHTLLSRFVESVRGSQTRPNTAQPELDYQTLEPFAYTSTDRLQALQIHFSKDRRITLERMKALLVMLSSFDDTIISFEIIGTCTNVIIQFVSTETVSGIIETYVIAYFPDATVVHSDEYLHMIIQENTSVYIIDVGLQQEFFRPILVSKNLSLDPLLGVCAILEKVAKEEQGVIQILFQSTCNSWTESIVHATTMYDGTSFFQDDPTAPKLALEKVRSPLFAVTIRVIGAAKDLAVAQSIAQKLCVALCVGMKSDFNQLIPLAHDGYDIEQRITDVYVRESHRLGMLLNVDELVSILHFPSENIISAKLFANKRKTIAAPVTALEKQFLLGSNEHAGAVSEVTCSVQDRVRHMHIIGATGTGKSTLLANLIAQDIEQKFSAVVFDPHGDLVTDIIAQTRKEYLDRIVLIDPSDAEYSVGLNILEAHSEAERELLSSDLVAAFRRHSTSWGDQMSTVLGNAIEVLLASTIGGTIHDLRRFLIEKDVRQHYLSTIDDPSLLYYWNREFQLSKGSAVGSIVGRLETFLRPRSIRNMLSQRKGIDISRLLDDNKIILCKLSQGLLGKENSFLLSSLLLSHIHQAILRRQQSSRRTPAFLYLDEFQNFIVPSVKEMLTGVRKYNVGLTLSHQNLNQVSAADSELLSTVLTNTAIRISFRVGEPDAKQLQTSFKHFDASDFQNLGNGEAILSIEQPQYDCSLTTFQLPLVEDAVRKYNNEYVITQSRQLYARKKKDVEQELFDSIKTSEKEETKITKKREEKRDADNTGESNNTAASQNSPAEKSPNTSTQSEEPDPMSSANSFSTHRYLQTLVKKMAEARGYTATLEAQLPDSTGQVDILLSKDNATIAVEISHTTNAEWEVHNINKCLQAKYDTVISVSGDIKQLKKIQEKCAVTIPQFNSMNVKFFTPDALFTFLDESIKDELPKEQTMKGYRVNVSYQSPEAQDASKKKNSIAQIILNSLKKRKP